MGLIQRDSFRITLISYSGAAIGYFNKVFLFTNFLTTDQVGLANLLITLSMVYAQIAAMGSHNIVLRFFPFFRQKQGDHQGFLFAVTALSLAGFALITMLFLVFSKPFTLFYQDSSPLLVEYAVYLIPLALATTLYLLFESYLRSLYKNILPSFVHEWGLRILTTLTILAYALGWISFPGFVFLYVLVHCIPPLILIVYTALAGHLNIKPVRSPLLNRLGKLMLVYGLFSLLNNLGLFLLISIDGMMVAGMIDLHATGIYTTMIFIASVMLIPYRSMIKVSGPVVAGYWKEKAMGQLNEVYKKATAGNLVIGALLFTLLWANLDNLFFFMPGEYQQGQVVFLLLGLGKFFDMVSGLNGVILLTSKKYRFDLVFTIGLVVFAIITNIILIPILGINGAAMASMLTLVFFNLARILFIHHHYKLQPFVLKQLWVPLIMAAAMLGSYFMTRADSVWLDIIIRSLAMVIVVSIPLYLLKISPELNNLTLRVLDTLTKRIRS